MQYRWDKRYPRTGCKPVHGGKTVFLSLVPALQCHGTGKIPECHPGGNTGILLLLNHSFRKTTACETQARDFSRGFLTISFKLQSPKHLFPWNRKNHTSAAPAVLCLSSVGSQQLFCAHRSQHRYLKALLHHRLRIMLQIQHLSM